jgi:murein DD-endopeptidase MepM/ murein hydrolase activator NlpD
MVADNSGWGSRYFPQIRISFRSSASIALPARLQAALLSSLLAGVSAFAYVGASRLGYEHVAAEKDAAAARAQSANSNLKRQVVGLQDKLAAFTRERVKAQHQAAVLESQAANLRDQLFATAGKLEAIELADGLLAQPFGDIEQQPPSVAPEANSQTGRSVEPTPAPDETNQAVQQERARNAALTARLGQMQADRAAEEAQFAQYKASLEETARELAELGAAQKKGAIRRDRARARLGEIWQKLSQIQLLPPGNAAAVAEAAKSSAGGATAQGDGGGGLADLGLKDVTRFERALRSAGVDVARILSQFGTAPGEGGPFVPPPKGAGATADAVSPEKLAAIQSLAKTLPVSAPLARYEIASPFGARVDPFNSRPSFHTGVDMDAPYSSPVYAAASGTVIYAGWLGDYGKAVEIDHGFGIVTLYGHLRRTLVPVGQNVAAQAEIGLVGTTGRSTGPHVHYEVRVDGQPEDPEKFMALSRLLPASAGGLTPAAAGPAGNSR